MVQTEVADNIAGDISYVVDILLEVKKRNKQGIYWDANKEAYLVSALI